MISINKIREKSGLLLIFLGVAMLAFILGEYFTSNQGSRKLNIGNIYGEDIEIADFENRVQEQEQALESINQKIDENTRKQIRDQVWNDMLRERIVGKEIKDLGLHVAVEEYNDIRYGQNVMPDYKNDPNFADKTTGQFNPENVKQYFSVIQEQYPLFWKTQRDRLLETRKVIKYNNLIKKGIYINRIQAEFEHMASNRRVNVDFVVGKYASIPDSTVKVTDDEIKEYYNKHKKEKKYEQEESRSIDYVTFDVKPTQEDIGQTEQNMAALAEPFRVTTDDSMFVVNNSGSRYYQPEIYVKGTSPAPFDSLISNGTKGTVVGPYRMGESVRLVKVVANGEVPQVNARHILLAPNAGQSSAQLKAQADSLINEIKKNKNFAELARTISTDKASGEKGGDLGWFGEGDMVKKFEEVAFSAGKGELKVAESEFGVHIIEVLDKKTVEQIKLAVIQKNIEPSKETINAAYNQASQFAKNYTTKEAFIKAAEEQKLNKQTAPNITPQNKFIPGIAEPSQILRWMYEHEVGEVSEVFDLNNQFVVATLTMATEDGEPSYEAVKDQMERELIREKKAEMLTARIKGNTLSAIAASLGETVQTANDVTFNTPVLSGGGREPKVIGVAVTLPANKLSKPVVGENGVYIMQVKGITEAPKTTDYKPLKAALAQRISGRSDNSIYSSLVELAEVKDLRYKFY